MNFNLQFNRDCLKNIKAQKITIGMGPLLMQKYKILQKNIP